MYSNILYYTPCGKGEKGNAFGEGVQGEWPAAKVVEAVRKNQE